VYHTTVFAGYYDCAMSLVILSVQLHKYAKNCVAVCVHPNTVVKLENKTFSVLAWHGLY